MTYANVLEYTYIWYPTSEAKILQTIAFENKTDINVLLAQVAAGVEKPIEISINEIRKNLKQKTKKFVVSKDYDVGNLMTFAADSEQISEQKMFIIPSDKEDLAKIRFRYYKRSKIMQGLFNKLIMALKSSKVKFTSEIIKIKNVNYIEFRVTNPLSNEAFWGTLKLWSKR